MRFSSLTWITTAAIALTSVHASPAQIKTGGE